MRSISKGLAALAWLWPVLKTCAQITIEAESFIDYLDSDDGPVIIRDENGAHVGYINDGEWMEYEVWVPLDTGIVTVEYSLAGHRPGRNNVKLGREIDFSLRVGGPQNNARCNPGPGKTAVGQFLSTTEPTTEWGEFRTFPGTGTIDLSSVAGTMASVTLCFDKGTYVNIDNFTFTKEDTGSDADATYLGCFVDQVQRDLDGSLKRMEGTATIEACQAYCIEKGYAFFGLQYHSECRCDNSYGRWEQAPQEECNTKCDGDASQACGGSWRNSVYKTGIDPPTLLQVPGVIPANAYESWLRTNGDGPATGVGGGSAIRMTKTLQWLEYTVNIKPGNYEVQYWLSGQSDQMDLSLLLDATGEDRCSNPQANKQAILSETNFPGTSGSQYLYYKARFNVVNFNRVNANVPHTLTLCTGNTGSRARANLQRISIHNPYHIDVVDMGSTPTEFDAVFKEAARIWESLIVSDVPDKLTSIVPAGGWFSPDFGPLYNQPVDDLVIGYKVGPLDGPFGTVAQAGPYYYRTPSAHPVSCTMQFDSDDLDFLTTTASFLDVVVHEMGHCLGLGTMWEERAFHNADFGCGNSRCQSNQRYGKSDADAASCLASQKWSELGWPGALKIEQDGGPGTHCMHWEESPYGPDYTAQPGGHEPGEEIMTGWLNANNILSAVSVGALGDLGYNVQFFSPEVEDFNFRGQRRRKLDQPAHHHGHGFQMENGDYAEIDLTHCQMNQGMMIPIADDA
ncbi:unnamed protein product [Chrysoparadoxa australica]